MFGQCNSRGAASMPDDSKPELTVSQKQQHSEKHCKLYSSQEEQQQKSKRAGCTSQHHAFTQLHYIQKASLFQNQKTLAYSEIEAISEG
jgi:hypothetical protein